MLRDSLVTCYLQHATPAAFYAHAEDRGDSDKISRDFMESGVDVAFGGGRKVFEKAYKDSGENYEKLLEERGYEVIYDEDDMDDVHSGPRGGPLCRQQPSRTQRKAAAIIWRALPKSPRGAYGQRPRPTRRMAL